MTSLIWTKHGDAHVDEFVRTFNHDRRRHAINPAAGLCSGLPYSVCREILAGLNAPTVTFLPPATWQTFGLLQTGRLQEVMRVKTARAKMGICCCVRRAASIRQKRRHGMP